MKIYQTKNRLLFMGPVTLHQLGLSCDKHKEVYGRSPRFIFMTDEDWERYEEISTRDPQVRHSYSTQGYPKITKGSPSLKSSRTTGIIALAYRGIPVIQRSSWGRLMKK